MFPLSKLNIRIIYWLVLASEIIIIAAGDFIEQICVHFAVAREIILNVLRRDIKARRFCELCDFFKLLIAGCRDKYRAEDMLKSRFGAIADEETRDSAQAI